MSVKIVTGRSVPVPLEETSLRQLTKSFKAKWTTQAIDVSFQILNATGRPIVCGIVVVHVTIAFNSILNSWSNVIITPICAVVIDTVMIQAYIVSHFVCNRLKFQKNMIYILT